MAVRWFHWINFPVLFLMIWSGTLIYWANGEYKLNAGLFEFKFYPESLYKSLNIPHRLAEGMSLHFVFMWIFLLNGFLYAMFLIFSGQWRLILPNRKSWKEAFLVLMHDLHLRKKAPEFIKYNAAQRVAYTGVILMGVLSLITGLVIYKPATFPSLTSFVGGYENARLIHFVLTILFILFFIVHIVQVIIAGWNNFRAIVTGWEITEIQTSNIEVANSEVEIEQLNPVGKSNFENQDDEEK